MGLNTLSGVRKDVDKNLRNSLGMNKLPGQTQFDAAERNMINGLNKASPLTVLASGELPAMPNPQGMGGPFEAVREADTKLRNGDAPIPMPEQMKQVLPSPQQVLPTMEAGGPDVMGQFQQLFTAPLKQLGLVPGEQQEQPSPQPSRSSNTNTTESRRRTQTREAESELPYAQKKAKLSEPASPY